ncbi:hypothetical protein QWY77_00565 [Thalassotalea ponticola]|uniref:hypothetical protein n=1 Tax=Thalassotalea ponticola TaxID=1523392 RepID=UPI0025B58B10|nr:hypothetical protein [Thalassotalea ponticola]MDN3651276.1 hypothetical protein [Thalassotalea ponticola]
MSTLRIDIDLNDHNRACLNTMNDVICEQLILQKSRLHERLARVSNQFCDKAVVRLDSLQLSVDQLEQNSGVVQAHYEFDAYHDFEDIEKHKQITESWRFLITEQQAVFELDMPQLHHAHEL